MLISAEINNMADFSTSISSWKNKLFSGIKCFSYSRSYIDGSRFYITPIPERIISYFQADLFLWGHTEMLPNSYQNGAVLEMTFDSSEVRDAYRNKFNEDYVLYIITKYENYTEFFVISGYADNPSILNYYLNNLNNLYAFLYKFKEQNIKLLKIAKKYSVVLPHRPNVIKQENYLNFKKQIIKPHNRTLTAREQQCAMLLIEGRSCKAIGKILNISPRTVENHINNIKQKFNCHKQSALALKLQQIGNFN